MPYTPAKPPPPAFRNKHLVHVEEALLAHAGPAFVPADIRPKLAYYDAILCRPVLERLLPDNAFAAFDAFWLASEYEKAYAFVIDYPPFSGDPEQVAFATTLWNLLDAKRWEREAEMESQGDRVKRFFGKGVLPVPQSWYDSVQLYHPTSGYAMSVSNLFQGQNVGDMSITNMIMSGGQLSANGDALLTELRVAIHPVSTPEDRMLLDRVTLVIDGPARHRDAGSRRSETFPVLDLLDRPRPIWFEVPHGLRIDVRLQGVSQVRNERKARLVVFLDGWKGDGVRQRY